MPAPSPWAVRLLRLFALFTLANGVGLLTRQIPSQLSGLNTFEIRDLIQVGYGCLLVAGSIGAVRVRRSGIRLLVAAVLLRTAQLGFGLVPQFLIVGLDTLGIVLFALVLGIHLAVAALLFWLQRRRKSEALGLPKTWKVATTATALIVAAIYLALVLPQQDARDDQRHPLPQALDLRGTGIRNFRRFFPHASPAPSASGFAIVEQRDGLMEITGLPFGSHVRWQWLIDQNYIEASGPVRFFGKSWQSPPLIPGGLPLRGIEFSNDDGPITGTLTLATDARRNLYIFVENFSVYGKESEGAYVAPDPARPRH